MSITQIASETCVMERSGQCVLGKVKVIDWIECERCFSWAHAPCVGLANKGNSGFICCLIHTDSNISKCLCMYRIYHVVFQQNIERN